MKALDLFCGAGGSSDGARAAGATMVGGIDMDRVALDTWQENFPDGLGYCDRLEAVSLDKMVEQFGDIDLLLASPECTNHSPAKGSAPRSEASKNTALQVAAYAKRLRPRWLVIENVVQMRTWRRYEELKRLLRAEDYNLSFQVLDAADFGVPQTRRRLFLLGDNERPPPQIRPAPAARMTARAILDPPGTWPVSPLRTARRAPETLARAERAMAVLGADQAFLLVYYGSDCAGGWQRLDRPLRTITTLDRFALVEPSEDGPTMRMLQPSELRRAMGLSDGFRLERGTRRDRIRLLGNGVCAPVMEAVVRQLTSSEPPEVHPSSLENACTRDLFHA